MGPGLRGQNPEPDLTPPGRRRGLGGRTPLTPPWLWPPGSNSAHLGRRQSLPHGQLPRARVCRGHRLSPPAARPPGLSPGLSRNLEGGLESVPLREGAEAPRQGPTTNPCLATQLWGALGGVRGMGLCAGTGWAPRGGQRGARALCWPHDGSTWQARGVQVAPAVRGQTAEPRAAEGRGWAERLDGGGQGRPHWRGKHGRPARLP